jgi:hypothetical protein
VYVKRSRMMMRYHRSWSQVTQHVDPRTCGRRSQDLVYSA